MFSHSVYLLPYQLASDIFVYLKLFAHGDSCSCKHCRTESRIISPSLNLQVFMVLSCTIAVGTNLSQFICIGRFTAVSFQVLGHMKTILVLILGFLFFGKEGLNIQVVVGMIIAVIGMVWYGNASSKPGGKERRSHSMSRNSQQKHGGSAESSEADEKV